jgi:hypothetical protein
LRQTLVILGSGYTARFVLPLAERRYARILATSREPNQHLSHVAPDRRVQFDLSEPSTWRNVPSEADLLWCFPAQPLKLVQQFAVEARLSSRTVAVLGSTSAYEVPMQATDYPPPWIDETAPIDPTKPRVRGEEFLRNEFGAVVLRVAGIYGPGRSPIDWIKTGRVGPSRKYVNLIHVEDLAEICLAVLEQGAPNEAYNVSDGTPRTWAEICRRAQDCWGIQSVTQIDADVPPGKRITNGKLLAMLQNGHQQLRYPDLWSALAQLAAPTG